MTTQAWPRVGVQGFSAANYQDQYAGETGIVSDFTGDAFGGAVISDVNNTVTFGAVGDMVSVAGFVAKVTAVPVVTAPGVASPTTYYIYAEYDSALQAVDGSNVNLNPAGPVSIKIATTSPTGSGKAWCLLYTFPRVASQALSSAWSQRTDYRRWLGRNVHVDALRGVRAGYTFARGDVAHVNGYRVVYEPVSGVLTWVNHTTPVQIAFPKPAALIAQDAPPEAVKGWDGFVSLQGTLKRSNGAQLNNGADVNLGTMPTGWIPGTSGSATSNRRLLFLAVFADGTRGVVTGFIGATGDVWMSDASVPTGKNILWIALDNNRYLAEQ